MTEVSHNSTNKTKVPHSVFAELVAFSHKNLLASIPASLICATVVYISLHQSASNYLIFYWFIAVFLVAGLRLLGLFFYNHYPQNENIHLYVFIFGVACSAALWGIVDSVLMPPANHLQQMIIIVVIAGVTGGGVQTLNAYLTASLIYVSFIILPLCAWLFLQNTYDYSLLGGTMIIYLLFMIITCVRGNKLLVHTLSLQHENQAANISLSESYKVLEEHDHNLALINNLNTMLQACKSSRESYNVVEMITKELFFDYSGALIIVNSKSKLLEIVATWGDDINIKSAFSTEDCWALRVGKEHLFTDQTANMSCSHFNTRPSSSLCVPLAIQGKILGLLILFSPTKNDISDEKIQIAKTFCNVFQLSLINIKLRESLYNQSIHDQLTGLFNRRYLDETLPREILRVIREKNSLCVAMIDLDNFKKYNDTYGHDAGDEVLKFVGALFKESFRGSDVACRFGGEELIAILLNTNIAASYARLDSFREAVKQKPVLYKGQPLPSITISIGVAEAPLHGATAKDMIRAADEALYAAKKNGRDCIERYSKNIS